MPNNETNIIQEISFPIIPESIDTDLKEYLVALEIVLRDSLKGSMLLRRTLEDGLFGN